MKDINRHPEQIVYLSLITLSAVWLLSQVGAPWLMAGDYHLPAAVLYQGYSVICHQIPERSFHFHDLPLAVCARCTGIYAGFTVGLIAAPLLRDLRETATPPRWWLIAAALPMAVDYSGDLLGLFTNKHLSRALTGAVLGAFGAWFILPALISVFSQTGELDRNYRHTVKGEAE